MKIKMKNWKDIKNIETMKMPAKITHYKIDFPGGPTHKSKKKIDYEYYLCNFCGKEIKIEKEIDKRTGGIVKVPINDYKTLSLALHNKCLKPCLKEINETYNLNL